MIFPLVCDLAAEGVPVRVTCGVLGFSAQAFYKWRSRPCSDRDWADAHTTNVIVDVHGDDPEFGYRFIADELEAAGLRSCERRVWRLCRAQRVWSTTTKKGRSGDRVEPAATAGYRTRGCRLPPADVTAFSGTVLVEWLNVSMGRDSAPVWRWTHRHLMREGWAFVGVSAQAAGVQGGAGIDPNVGNLRQVDPERYRHCTTPVTRSASTSSSRPPACCATAPSSAARQDARSSPAGNPSRPATSRGTSMTSTPWPAPWMPSCRKDAGRAPHFSTAVGSSGRRPTTASPSPPTGTRRGACRVSRSGRMLVFR